MIETQLNNEVLKMFYKLREGLLELQGKQIIRRLCCNSSPAVINILKNNLNDFGLFEWDLLSSNPAAIELLLKYPEKIVWTQFSRNPAPEAIIFMKQNPDKIHWYYLCDNPSPEAFELVYSEINKKVPLSNNYTLSKNPIAIDYALKNPECISIYSISKNPSPKAVDWIRNNLHSLSYDNLDCIWQFLSLNPSAIDFLLERGPEKIDWRFLSANPSLKARKMLIEKPEKIYLDNVCYNPYVFDIIEYLPPEKKESVLKCINLFENPAIFTYDYDAMRAARAALHEDFAKWWWSPARVEAFLAAAGGDIEALDEL